MPTSVVAAVAAYAASTAAVSAGMVMAGGIGAALVGAAASAATSMAMNAVFSSAPDQPQGPQAAAIEMRDNLVTVRQPIADWQYIYGRTRVSGALTFAHESADEYFHLVITLAGHVCTEIQTIQFADEVVPLDGSGEATGKYAGFVRIQKSLGDEAGQPFADLVAESEGKWTDAHRQSGRTKIYVRLKPSADLFPTGIPNITAIIKGKKVYDPRTGLTAWSDNASLCIADFVCDQAAGLEATYADEIDSAQLIAAANIDDESVATVAGSEARYTLNGAFAVNAAPGTVLGRMLTANAGKVLYVGGLFMVMPAAYVTPSITFTEDDCRGVPHIIPRLSAADLCNGVKGLYISEPNLWQASDFPPVTNATYLAEDEGERSWLELSLPFTKSAATAQRIAKIELERRRQQITVEWKGKFNCYRLQPGNTGMLTFAMMGWSSKVFEVAQTSLVFEDDGQGGIRLGADHVLRETASSVFDWNSGEETAVDAAPDTNLPDPWTVAAPGILSVTEALYQTTGSAGVKVRATLAWSAASANFATAGGRYQAQYAVSGSGNWKTVPTTPETSVVIDDVSAGRWDFRVKASNLLGVSSAYSNVWTQEILGLSAPPSDLTGFGLTPTGTQQAQLSWTKMSQTTDLDVLIGGRIMVRWSPKTSSAVWNDGVEVANVPGDSTGAPVPLMTGTYMARAQDSSGNQSANFNSVITTAPDLVGYNAVAALTEDPVFTGTKANTVVVGGALQLDAATPIDDITDLIDDWGYIDSMGGVASAGTYDFSTYIDGTAVYTSRVTATLKTLSFDNNELIDGRLSAIDDWGLIDGPEISDVNAALFIATTNDDPAGTPTWSAWQPFLIGDYKARAFKFRLVLASSSANHNISVINLGVSIDLPDREDGDRNIASGAGTKTVTYTLTPAFKALPKIALTAKNMATGDYATISNELVTSFDVIFKNSAGAAVSRNFDWQAKGY